DDGRRSSLRGAHRRVPLPPRRTARGYAATSAGGRHRCDPCGGGTRREGDRRAQARWCRLTPHGSQPTPGRLAFDSILMNASRTSSRVAVRPAADLAPIMNARAIAIIGASKTELHELKLTGRPVKFLRKHGYTGKVFAVNPKYSELDGVPCYPSVSAIPEPVDVAGILLPTSTGSGKIGKHTSELQSLTNIVCRLLLEKKKTHIRHTQPVTHRTLYAHIS